MSKTRAILLPPLLPEGTYGAWLARELAEKLVPDAGLELATYRLQGGH